MFYAFMLWLQKTVAALRMVFNIQIFVLEPFRMMICLHVSFVDRHNVGLPPLPHSSPILPN